MRILGIDPGTITLGYGVIDSRDDEVTMVDYGALTAPKRSPMGERLSYLYQGLLKIISRCHPDCVSIERPFVDKNAQAALAIGKAQAVAILAAANKNIPSFEYTPAQVKQRVSNYGASSKEQIQQMVAFQLGLNQIPDPSDAADALAVALCHLHETRLSNLLTKSEEGRR